MNHEAGGRFLRDLIEPATGRSVRALGAAAAVGLMATVVACAAASTRTVAVASPHTAPPASPYVCDPSTAMPDGSVDGGSARVAVPTGRHIAPGLHGLQAVYRGEHAPRGEHPFVVQRAEPPPHAAIDFTQVSCAVHVDEHGATQPTRCEPTPGGRRDYSTPEGSFQAAADEAARRVRTCFAASDRAPSGADLHHVEHAAEPWITTDARTRVVLVRTARIVRVAEQEGFGCEGVHDRPCDRDSRPTGRMVDATRHMDVALYALGPGGSRVLQGLFPATAVDLRLLYLTVPVARSYSGYVAAPELEVPGYHPLDANSLYYDGAPGRIGCYYAALLPRLLALDLDPQDRAARLAVLYDLATLAFLTHDLAAAPARIAALHAELDGAPDASDTVVRPFVAERIGVLDALAAGELSVDDPCHAP